MKMFYKKGNLKIIIVLAVVFAALGSGNFAFAAEPQTPGQVATEFYRWYLRELNREKMPLNNKKTVSKYISRRLNGWLNSKAYEDYDADYFLDAQDFDEEWEQTVSASKAVIKGNRASLAITVGVFKDGRKYNGIGKHVLRLKMVKENGLWKIDRVNNH